MSADKPIKPPRPPAGLGTAGRRLWGELAGPFGFGPDEVPVLRAACATVDAIAALEGAIEADGLQVEGSAGQMRLNPAVAEVRQQRLALARLLGALRLPTEDEKPMTAAQERARKAAMSRWDRPGARTRAAG